MRSRPFQRVDSCTSSASPRPRAIKQDRGEDGVLQREHDRVGEEPVVARPSGSCPGSCGPGCPLSSGQLEADILQHQQQREHEEHQDERRPWGWRRAIPGGTPGHPSRAAHGPRRALGGCGGGAHEQPPVAGHCGRSAGAGEEEPVTRRPTTGLVLRVRVTLLTEDRVISSLSLSTESAVTEDRVAHQGQPGAVRRVERLLEVHRHGSVALAGHLVDGDQPRVVLACTCCSPGPTARRRRCPWPARRPARPRTSSRTGSSRPGRPSWSPSRRRCRRRRRRSRRRPSVRGCPATPTSKPVVEDSSVAG